MKGALFGSVAAVIVLGALLNVILSNDPNSDRLVVIFPLVLVLFLASLYATVRVIFSKISINRNIIFIFWRQGLLLGIYVGAILYLKGIEVLSGLDAILLLVATILMELFFQADKTNIIQNNDE